MKGLRVRLFGKVVVEWDGRAGPSLSAKALELLCYLVVHRDRAHTREALAEALWPETSYPQSKKYLRQTLWQLQATLGDHNDGSNGSGHAPAGGLLLLNPGWVRLNPGAGLWLDVQVFEDAWAQCRDVAGSDLTDAQAQSVEEAVTLYKGDLIEAWYQDWCIFERDRLQLTYLAMLEKLMSWCEARGAFARGIAYGQRILRHDQAREFTHRQLMRLYHRAGDRTPALRQYQRCVAALAKEFNLTPSAETTALYQQVREGRLEDGPDLRRPRPRAGDHGAVVLDLEAQLEQIQTGIAALQVQVERLTALTRMVVDIEQKTRQTLRKTH
jgi:DNA-binding SARP family transcriptional activator